MCKENIVGDTYDMFYYRAKPLNKLIIYQTVRLIYPIVAFSLLMILAGLPTTIEWSGMSQFTKLDGAIRTSEPIVILPTIIALVPIQQLSPILFRYTTKDFVQVPFIVYRKQKDLPHGKSFHFGVKDGT